jgi:hypothetical protein
MEKKVRLKDTCRLAPSRFPSDGILDAIAAPGDLPLIFELESWTNDRISAELGVLHRLAPDEWVVGRPMSSVIMAAYCHPRPGGGRFNGEDRGAWYAALTLETAHAEVAYHRWKELLEVGAVEARLEMRLYLADFHAVFHDVRSGDHAALHHPVSYAASQEFARPLLESGANGVLYRSVRHAGGECVACFRPKLVANVRIGGHFQYRWEGTPVPRITRLG